MQSNQEPGFRRLFDCETWTYTYLLFYVEYYEGVIIDPVRKQFERDLQMVEELGVELKYVLDTHIHADHITAASLFRQTTGAKTVLREPVWVPCADILLHDGEVLQFGRHWTKSISIAGHTDTCTCFFN